MNKVKQRYKRLVILLAIFMLVEVAPSFANEIHLRAYGSANPLYVNDSNYNKQHLVKVETHESGYFTEPFFYYTDEFYGFKMKIPFLCYRPSFTLGGGARFESLDPSYSVNACVIETRGRTIENSIPKNCNEYEKYGYKYRMIENSLFYNEDFTQPIGYILVQEVQVRPTQAPVRSTEAVLLGKEKSIILGITTPINYKMDDEDGICTYFLTENRHLIDELN